MAKQSVGGRITDLIRGFDTKDMHIAKLDWLKSTLDFEYGFIYADDSLLAEYNALRNRVAWMDNLLASQPRWHSGPIVFLDAVTELYRVYNKQWEDTLNEQSNI